MQQWWLLHPGCPSFGRKTANSANLLGAADRAPDDRKKWRCLSHEGGGTHRAKALPHAQPVSGSMRPSPVCVPRAPRINIQAWVFRMSWHVDLEMRVPHVGWPCSRFRRRGAVWRGARGQGASGKGQVGGPKGGSHGSGWWTDLCQQHVPAATLAACGHVAPAGRPLAKGARLLHDGGHGRRHLDRPPVACIVSLHALVAWETRPVPFKIPPLPSTPFLAECTDQTGISKQESPNRNLAPAAPSPAVRGRRCSEAR